jgi:glycosyltransferase involved in cell wall biosynthesis/tetratricopeptide (TPR) repeat protein
MSKRKKPNSPKRRNPKKDRREQPKRNERAKTTPKSKASQKKGAQKKTTNKKSSANTLKAKANNIRPSDKISLVIPCYNEESRVGILTNGIKQFDKNWGAKYELIVVDDGSSDNTVALLQEHLTGLSNASNVEIVPLEDNVGKGGALKEGVARATGDYILTLDADMATSPMELKNWLARLNRNSFNKDEILIGSREHRDSKVDGRGRRAVGLMFNLVTQMMTSLTARDTQCGFKLYPAGIAKELFSNMKVKGWAHDVELLYKAQLDGNKVTSMPVTWKHVDDSKVNVLSDGINMVFTTIFTALRIRFDWFIGQPLREIGKSFEGKEHSIYRLLFAVLTIGLLFFMPYISKDFGVTGDEHAQKIYGELIVKHFDTNGEYKVEGGKYKGEDALTMKPNLWYYGGLFDFIAAKTYFAFGTDPYDTRHLLNAFVGFLLMLFTGLLAKEITGSWKVAFLALLMIAISPRIFGHSMNNPKDIPFAAAYIFTLLNLIRFVKQLPKPGTKTIIYLILGIGAAIGIRIGGLLLVAYLGLFTGIAFLWEKHLRKELTSIGTIGRIAFYGVLIAALGFLVGIANWPYALQDPIANAMKSLEEMSNFDWGIQMMYEGKHLWSDQLPWYYIPKWMIMTAPIAALIGAILFIPVFLKDKKRNVLLTGLVLFAGFFPVAYALYQGSSLYDGMRHFLFVYPILIVAGAYGWGRLTELIDNKAIGLVGAILPVLLLALPTMWMMKNHPYQYTYVNEFYGGTKASEAKYETDYWMTSVKPLCEWFVENVPEATSEEGVTIMMSSHNEAAKHYFKKLNSKVRVMFQRYPERDRKDTWDYAIFFARFRNVGHLKSGAWLGYEVLHEEKVDGVTIGAVLKKGDSQAGAGRKAITEGRLDTAITILNAEVEKYPKNEVAWLALADAYNRSRDFKNMNRAVDGALKLSDSHINTIANKGLRFFSEYEATRATAPNPALLDSATYYYEKSVETNYKFSTGFYYLAFCYANKNDNAKVMEMVEQFAINNGNFPQAYDLGIRSAQAMQDNLRLKYFQARKAMTQNNHQQAMNLVNEVYRSNPKYKPAADLKAMYDDLLVQQGQQPIK